MMKKQKDSAEKAGSMPSRSKLAKPTQICGWATEMPAPRWERANNTKSLASPLLLRGR